MSETIDTNTPNGDSKNGYLKSLRKYDSVPQICTTDLGIKENFKKLQEGNGISETDNLFDDNTGVAVVGGDEIAKGEVVLLVGDVGKEHPGETYDSFKAKAMKESERTNKDKEKENTDFIDLNGDGIDDRLQ